MKILRSKVTNESAARCAGRGVVGRRLHVKKVIQFPVLLPSEKKLFFVFSCKKAKATFSLNSVFPSP